MGLNKVIVWTSSDDKMMMILHSSAEHARVTFAWCLGQAQALYNSPFTADEADGHDNFIYLIVQISPP